WSPGLFPASVSTPGPPFPGRGYDRFGRVPVLPFAHGDLLPLAYFQVLVVGDEVGTLPQQVAGYVVQALHPVPQGVGDGDSQNLVVGPLLIPHVKHAHGAGAYDTPRESGLRDDDEGVQLIAVLGQGVGDKPVVGGVVDRGEEHPVQKEPAGAMVELVLVAASLGNFHHYEDGLHGRFFLLCVADAARALHSAGRGTMTAWARVSAPVG